MKRLYKSAADADCGCEVPEEHKASPSFSQQAFRTPTESVLGSPLLLEQGSGRESIPPEVREGDRPAECTPLGRSARKLFALKPMFEYLRPKVIGPMLPPDTKCATTSNRGSKSVLMNKYCGGRLQKALTFINHQRDDGTHFRAGNNPLGCYSSAQGTPSTRASFPVQDVSAAVIHDHDFGLSMDISQSLDSLNSNSMQSIFLPPKTPKEVARNGAECPPSPLFGDNVVVVVIRHPENRSPLRKFPKEKYLRILADDNVSE